MLDQNAQMISFNASADYIGAPGAVHVPEYEDVILDMIARKSVALQRFRDVPATGSPHRYFEQTGMVQGQMTTTGGQGTNPLAVTAGGPTRIEQFAAIKGVIAQSNISLFDKLVTQQQKKFASVVTKDVEDVVNGVNVKRASQIWAGASQTPAGTTSTDYSGLLNQITQYSTIGPGSSIIDGLKAEVAAMLMATTDGTTLADVRPTAIYVNPLLADLIDREAKAQKVTLDEVEVVAGVKVKAISTQAGVLPLISERFLPVDKVGGVYGPNGAKFAKLAGYTNYFAAILTEDMIELPYVSGDDENPEPMLFQLGLVGNLSGQFVAVKFDCIVAKGGSYAHSLVVVQRP